jgi:hypothetical protein
MTTGPATDDARLHEGEGHDDAIAVPLSFLLWGLVTIALAYGVISTLSKAVNLFS